MRTKARHAAISFEVVEWSEQLIGELVPFAVEFKSDSAPDETENDRR